MGVREVHGDRMSKDTLERAFAKTTYDCVIDAIAYGPDPVRALRPYLANAAGRYLLISSAWTYFGLGPGAGRHFSEAALPPGTLPGEKGAAGVVALGFPEVTQRYVAGKLDAEGVAQTLNCPLCIARPVMVSGHGDHNGRIAFYVSRIIDGGPLLLVDEEEKRFQLMDVQDCAVWLATLAATRDIRTGVVNVAPRRDISVHEIIGLVQSALERKAHIVAASPRNVERLFPEYLAYEPFSLPMGGYDFETSRVTNAFPLLSCASYSEWITRTVRQIMKEGCPMEKDFDSRRKSERRVMQELGA